MPEMSKRIQISFFEALEAKRMDCLQPSVAYLEEVWAVQARGFEELALEGEEGRERGQRGRGAARRKVGIGHDLLERKENRSGSWTGERTALRRRKDLK